MKAKWFGMGLIALIAVCLVANPVLAANRRQATPLVTKVSKAALTELLPGTPSCPSSDPAFAKDPEAYGSDGLSQMLCVPLTHKVKVAVVDYGVNATPQDAGSMIPGYNMVDGSSNVADNLGHGTYIASRIHTVCPVACQIFGVKVADNPQQDGTGGNAAGGIIQAVNMGAQVINFSLGSLGANCDLNDPSNHHWPDVNAAISYAWDHNVPVVISAGNCGRSESAANWIANDNPQAIRVCGYDEGTLLINGGSNYGSLADLCAVNNSWVDGPSGLVNNGGTSYAAPIVAGEVGNMLGYNNAIPVAAIKPCLLSSASPLKDPSKGPKLAVTFFPPLTCQAVGYVQPRASLVASKIQHGKVSDEVGGLVCPGSCSTTIYGGASDTLDAESDAGYQFAGWTGAAASCGRKVTCTLTIQPGVFNFGGKFVARMKTQIRVKVTGRGMVVGSGVHCGSGECRYLSDLSGSKPFTRTYRAVPQLKPSKWRFSHWTGACQGTKPTCSLRITPGKVNLFGAVFVLVRK